MSKTATEIDFAALVHAGVESDTLDYKGPVNFATLPKSGKVKFVRHCLALANTSGGFVVVGVEEDTDGCPAVYTGLTEEECHSFDPSTVGPFINRYVEPPVDFTIHRPLVDGKRYAVFEIKPFRSMPHVCTCAYENELQLGVFYIRTADASSRPAYRASEMHQLIARCLRNQKEALAQMLREVLQEGILPVAGPEKEQFEEELLHSRNFFARRSKHTRKRTVNLELSIAPNPPLPGPLQLPEIQQTVNDLIRHMPKTEMDSSALESTFPVKNYFTNTSLRSLPEGGECQWQFFRSGLFHYQKRLNLEEDGGWILGGFPEFLTEMLLFMGNYYSSLRLGKIPVQVSLRLDGVENVYLKDSRLGAFSDDMRGCREEFIELTEQCVSRELPQLQRELLRRMAERFNQRWDWQGRESIAGEDQL